MSLLIKRKNQRVLTVVGKVQVGIDPRKATDEKNIIVPQEKMMKEALILKKNVITNSLFFLGSSKSETIVNPEVVAKVVAKEPGDFSNFPDISLVT